MARLDDNWQIIELAGLDEPVEKPGKVDRNRQLELLRRVNIKKIFTSGKDGYRRNKNGFNA